MKAITLWQPWASLIACGVKTIETRSWAPPKSLIGQRIAIHAAKLDPSKQRWYSSIAAEIQSAKVPGIDPHFLDELPRGAVICTAILSDAWMVNRHERSTGVVRAESHEIMENVTKVTQIDPWGDFTPGRWLWHLSDIEVFDQPIPAKGSQRIWEWQR